MPERFCSTTNGAGLRTFRWGLTRLVDHAAGVDRDQSAHDGAAENPLQQHDRLALGPYADPGRTQLRTQVLDELRRDLAQRVVADPRSEMGSPRL
jgi:hypothetical protein